MKKTIILLGFISFSAVAFSQAEVVKTNYNNNSTKAELIALDKAGFKPVKLGEKIQTTMNGVVRHSEDYKPEYPINKTLIKKDVVAIKAIKN